VFSPLAHPLHWWKEDNICQSIWDFFFKRWYWEHVEKHNENMGNKLGTGWGPIENLIRTHWEQIENEKNPPYIPMSFLYQLLSSLRMLASIDFSIIMYLLRTLDPCFFYINITKFWLGKYDFNLCKGFCMKKMSQIC
jgi:hypothetical protein